MTYEEETSGSDYDRHNSIEDEPGIVSLQQVYI